MRNPYLLLIFTLIGLPLTAQLSSEETTVVEGIDRRAEAYFGVAKQIWDFAEVGYQEQRSSALLQELLEGEGFTVEAGVADIPTAFTATYGSGGPVIGVLGEFDALPGITQTASPDREERIDVNAGHACGHHLFGTGSAAAAIAVKNWLQENELEGTIRFYGTPAEEGGAGKVYMVRAGLFDDVDAVIHWHPSDGNSADAASSLSNKSAKFRFYGISAHAAAAPQNGRSALDGVEAMNHMVNMLREHVEMESRIHYVITRGGEAPNVIPDFAEVFYYVRHPEMALVDANFERVVKCAEGAALGTGTTMDYEVIHGAYNLLPNVTLGEVMHENLRQIGGVEYDAEEQAFAEGIAATFENAGEADLSTAAVVEPFQVIRKGSGGSTDVGDVSWAVPTVGLRTATWVPGTSAHSWQAIAAGGTSIGKKGMVVAAKTMALTAMDLFRQPELLERARAELNEQRGTDFVYKALLGDREPPLDYRN
ncbi:aminobenzoyl-glutamate utilization protein B [Neolewinella xylanilytica]|uniref:Aminobenzoyl-glutamate utilization protein B n=1 Tax=Neolewinella xylanilytica TaxID=1514080 RepID=A0A2S6I9D8_9BACT|nr:M20 family metallopeptidase [Neolewinella xylanilytica]PPK88092.1 aminobenzoyl-glutamate utilization protein B [Neolewinella xylanilytica]